MVVYYKCLCSAADRLKVAELQSKGYTVRVVSKDSRWRGEARLYNTRLPFRVIDEANKIGAPL